ncbi:MAG: hypothetical protein H7Y32_12725 [Chloroflexales bacterium]|nr:hypothetical protein [Chloroflexales bacterium]
MTASTRRLKWLIASAAAGLLIACGPATALPAAPPPPPSGEERLSDGGFEQGLEGWAPESEGDGSAPRTGAEFGRTGAGARFDTPEGSAGVSALIQEFAPANSYTLDFWVRPQRGSSRVGLQSNGTRSGLSTSRVIFLDAGEPTATIVFTAWDVNYAFQAPLEIGNWYRVRVSVDGARGVQTLDFNGLRSVTLTSARPFPTAALAFGDRQPRTDVYSVMWTNARVKDGLNGSYDYDDLSLHATQ